MQIIKLDSSSHVGYEMRHAALHGARRHGEAVEAFDGMLSKVASSPNVEIRRQPFHQYLRPPHVD